MEKSESRIRNNNNKMASRHSIKNRGFTLIETAVAILIFMIGAYMLSVSYINAVRGHLDTQKTQISLSNLKLALDKIWKDIKYGINFSTSTNCLSFTRVVDCKEETICFDNKNILVTLAGNTTSLIDNRILEITDFKISTQGIVNQSPNNYILNSPKTITISLSGNSLLKDKKIPFNIQMTVAPINSVFPTSSQCSR